MRVPWLGRLLIGCAAAALMVPTASPLQAQEAVISGRVTSAQGEPLGGASVVVPNTNYGATTAQNGTYTLIIPAGAVRGQEITLLARFIGYRPSTRAITLQAGTQEQNFELVADPLRLEEVVVTGVAEALSAKKLTFSVGKVDAEQLQEVPGTSALSALQGKVAGARLIPTSNQPGGEVAIRLRGSTSIGGRQDPLFVVDGVVTYFGLADIAAEDVERVEVVKGAAASALYGSNAANGVVQVFTKRGRSLAEGALQMTARFEAGVNNIPNRLQFSRSHAYRLCEPTSANCDENGHYELSAGGGRITKSDQIAENPYPVYFDHWDAMIDPGLYWTGYLSVGQRRGSTNFSASFQNTENKGVIFGLDGYNRQNFRLNLDQRLRPNLDASFSTFYGTSTNGRAAEAQNGGPFFALTFVQPDVDVAASCPASAGGLAGIPFCPLIPLSGDVANDANPMYELANHKVQQDRNRFSGSGRVRWYMVDWLSAEGTFGYDQEGQTYSDYWPFGFYDAQGNKQDGSLFQSSFNNYLYNGSVTLTSVRTFGGGIANTTRVAAYVENQNNRLLQSNAPQLIVGEVPHFAASNQPSNFATSREEVIRNQSFYAVTTFDVKDRYILDGLVRRDGSSLFGEGNRWATYYRVSGAWRVTEDFRLGFLDEWRLRASYGTAGLRPSYNDQYEILDVVSGGFVKQVLGNPLLKPARSAELELGTNVEFGAGRYFLEYSYSRKETKDQLLLVPLPAAIGFSDQWQNTGTLKASSHELTFGAQLVNTQNTSVTLNIAGDRTRQRITEWTIPVRYYGGAAQAPLTFFLGPDSDLGAMYGNRFVRNIDDLYDDPAKDALKGPGQAWSPDSVMINEDGYVVRRSAYGTLNELPIKYVQCKRQDPASGACLETTNVVQIGNANPDFNLSFGLTFRHKRFGVYALLDWKKGGDLYYGTRQWAFQATRDAVQDQSGKPENDATCGQVLDPMPSCPRKPFPYYGVGIYNGLDPDDFFIFDGSYAKLKELSLSYTFVRDQLRSVGLGGFNDLKLAFIVRNLFTITNYPGLDPEVSGVNGDPFQVRMDWYQYPQFRTFSAVVEFTF